MTTPMWMTDCPTEEVLAAFVDDRLDAPTRLKVTDHLASCAECREIVLMTTDFQQTEMPATLVHGRFGLQRWIAATAALAAAAAIAVVMLGSDPNMNDVIAASEPLEYRPAAGRLSGDFPHLPKVRRNRSGSPNASGLNLKKTKLQMLVPNVKNPHAAAVVTFLLATNKADFQRAIDQLSAAYQKADAEERDAIAVDLASAYIAHAAWGDEADYENALRFSNEAWQHKKLAAAAWNRAVALEGLHRDQEAILAWNDYLALDRASEWADEATSNREKLLHPDS